MGQDSTDTLHSLLLKPIIQQFVREQIRFRKQQPNLSFLLAVIWGLHFSVNWLKLLPWKDDTSASGFFTSAPTAAIISKMFWYQEPLQLLFINGVINLHLEHSYWID